MFLIKYKGSLPIPPGSCSPHWTIPTLSTRIGKC